jgi:hypothetical protein
MEVWLVMHLGASMRLLRLLDVESGPNDHVFHHPRVRALLVWLAAFCAVAAMFLYALVGSWKPGYFFGVLWLLLLLLALRIVTARFRPSNWLVRANENGVSVQYRSYLNYQLPADEPSVVFITYGEIASARLVRECVLTPDTSLDGATERKLLRYIELELSGDTAPLANALHQERTEKGQMQRRWYGRSSTHAADYPVTMTAPPFLRIRWNVVPHASKFLNYLRQHTRIADPVSLTKSFIHLQSLGREEQQKHLRDLATRGEAFTAIYIARKLYGCSLLEAQEMLEMLADRAV